MLNPAYKLRQSLFSVAFKLVGALADRGYLSVAMKLHQATCDFEDILHDASTSPIGGKQQASFPLLSIRLFKLIPISDEERDAIVGDLLEECQRFTSSTEAHIWLYKQVLKSVLPLAYKNLKSRLASYFGKRVR